MPGSGSRVRWARGLSAVARAPAVLDQFEKLGSFLIRQVLDNDGVKDNSRHAIGRFLELTRKPCRSRALVDCDWNGRGLGKRSTHPLHTLDLIRPDRA